MPIALILTILQAIIQDTPEAIALFQAVTAVSSQSGDPTPAQWTALVTAQAAAHTKVQAAA